MMQQSVFLQIFEVAAAGMVVCQTIAADNARKASAAIPAKRNGISIFEAVAAITMELITLMRTELYIVRIRGC
jgi:hypothetical protein